MFCGMLVERLLRWMPKTRPSNTRSLALRPPRANLVAAQSLGIPTVVMSMFAQLPNRAGVALLPDTKPGEAMTCFNRALACTANHLLGREIGQNQETDEDVRRRVAAEALGKIGDARAVEPLIAARRG